MKTTTLTTLLTPFLLPLSLSLAAKIDPSIAAIIDPASASPAPDPTSHSAAVDECTLLFTPNSCFAKNSEAKGTQTYQPTSNINHALMPMAYGDIPSTECTDLQSSPTPPKGGTGSFSPNNCAFVGNTYTIDPNCPSTPTGQFWMVNTTCTMNAVEVFEKRGCAGRSYWWDIKFMNSADPRKVVKDNKGHWCAGPGTNLGIPVMISSFRLLEGPPLPNPSGTCEGGKCKGVAWLST